MKKNMREIRLGAAVMAAALVMAPVQPAFAAEAAEAAKAAEGGRALQINEINSSPDDWVECINTGTETLDISDMRSGTIPMTTDGDSRRELSWRQEN